MATSTHRPKASQVVVALGVGFALFTVASGLRGVIWEEHDESHVQREVFGHVPSALHFLFYAILPVLFVVGAWLFAQRVKNWERGGPDRRPTTAKNIGRRLADF